MLQTLKLQESPDAVPKGELPRHMQLYCSQYLTDKVVPGNRITVIGIYSIRKSGVDAKVSLCTSILMTNETDLTMSKCKATHSL